MIKRVFIRVIFAALAIALFLTYAYFFPRTMELLDEKVTEGFDLKENFDFFSKCSSFAKTAVNEALYYIELIKYNIKENSEEKRDISPVIFTCLGSFPSESYNVTSNFGEREHPIYGKADFHNGIDIALPLGSDVTASWPGTVIKTGNDEIYGEYVIVEHSSGFFTKYCHLSKITVGEKALVKAGEKLGEAGSTGLSTGSHLHFEVTVDGKNIDPESCVVI